MLRLPQYRNSTRLQRGSCTFDFSWLRLNLSALNHDLFKRNCSASSVCRLCGALVEDVKHYFLFSPSFGAAHLLGDKWLLASDKKRIDLLLNGVSDLDFQSNVN